jgi:hypothetical protein
MQASLRTSGRVTARLLVLVAVLAAAVAAVSSPSATAASKASYFVNFNLGRCEAGKITVSPPSSASPWANDTQIAWRAHIWKKVNGTWADLKVATPWQWDDVVGGSVYAPYGQGGVFTINSGGEYAVSVEVYSYGLRGYYEWRLGLIISRYDGFNDLIANSCNYYA